MERFLFVWNIVDFIANYNIFDNAVLLPNAPQHHLCLVKIMISAAATGISTSPAPHTPIYSQ